MYVWDDTVGRYENRMKRLPRPRQIALGIACVDHALHGMENYLAAAVPDKSLGLLKETVKTLWETVVTPKQKQKALIERYARELNAINPGEDDPVLARGWGQLLDATLRSCDMATGDDPKELILDCLGYAYQAIVEMAIKSERKGARTALDDFEQASPLCQAAMKFQLESLKDLESEREVESALFKEYRFPPR